MLTFAAIVDTIFEGNRFIVKQLALRKDWGHLRLAHLGGLSGTDPCHGNAQKHSQQDKANLLEHDVVEEESKELFGKHSCTRISSRLMRQKENEKSGAEEAL
jgi:hypothetical protein